MRRTPLAPPRRVQLSDPTVVGQWPLGGPTHCGPERCSQRPIAREALAAAAPAKERLRGRFDPRGWFRRLERAASHRLSRTLYPRIPGLGLPYGWILEHRLTLTEAVVELDRLPAAFDGLRILMISDIHAGPFLSATTLERAIARLVALDADLILLPGDMVTSRVDELETNSAAFESLRAPLGTFAVLGNHDHYTGEADRLSSLLGERGIEVLHNRSHTLRRVDSCLSLAGVDDMLMGRPDLDAALSAAQGPVILMSHNPDMLFEAARRNVALMLSGHTHGGQVRLPGLPVMVRQSRYRLDEGAFAIDRTQAIVSRGLGAVGIPLRVACPPEAILITLKRSDQDRSAPTD